ncbi:BgTH12-05197 [Blumeria graminis f. sp. triticale]|uniref:BgTH12-05197 n=1 Tax=Blumeria graminis f. sp. triticale TaxID=1689686 RepID=A0A9W4D1W4_BLUGR|nr:BgTH12-05197 [Blumeria graminis f. sp. triticale]
MSQMPIYGARDTHAHGKRSPAAGRAWKKARDTR